MKMRHVVNQGLDDMASVGGRLQQRLDELGWTVADLKEKVGPSPSLQAIYKVLRDPTAGFNSRTASKIAFAIGVHERWLVAALGPKDRDKSLREDETEFIENFRDLSPEEKRGLITIMRGMTKKKI